MRGKLYLLAGVAAAMCGAAPANAQSLSDAIAAGHLIFDVRTRYETVSQAGFANDAEAFTVRTRIGWETGSWNNFKGLIEFDDTRTLNDNDYNDAVGAAEPFPVIADPEVTELNRAQITFTPSSNLTATLGRQRINFDNQRFVVGVGWRQDEQTFDALRFDVNAGPVKASVAYVDQVNRIFAETADFDSDSVLINASFDTGLRAFQPTFFLYSLDFDNSAANSSTTSGLRITGAGDAGGVAWSWSGTYAHQSDYANNPLSFSLSYWGADIQGSVNGFTGKLGYESLEGDGAKGFATPLATLHAFQGWTDVFLGTPAGGIDDFFVQAGYTFPQPVGPLSNLALMAIYHDFESELTGADLGDEFGLQATAKVTPHVSLIAKYADYSGVTGYADREKLWFGVQFTQ